MVGCPRCGGVLRREKLAENGHAIFDLQCYSCGRFVLPGRIATREESREANLMRAINGEIEQDIVAVPGVENLSSKRGDTCLIAYCNNVPFAKGWCHKHYFKARSLYIKTGEDEPFVLAQEVAFGEGMISQVFYEGDIVLVTYRRNKFFGKRGTVIKQMGNQNTTGWIKSLFVSFDLCLSVVDRRVLVKRG